MFKEIDELLLSSKFINQRGYWLNRLSLGNDFKKTELPFKSQKKHIIKKEFEKIKIQISDDLFNRLMKLGKQSELSIYIILLTTLKLLIFRYTQNEDIIIASPVYKRNITAETLNDQVFIRDTMDDGSTFIQHMLEIRESVLQAYENQDYPSAKLMEHLYHTPPTKISNSGGNLLTDIICILSNIHDNKIIDNNQDKDKLIFTFEEKENHLNGHILYDGNVYERIYMHWVSKHFVRILENSTRDVKINISDVSFSTLEEDRAFIIDFNQTQAEYPKNKTLVELFEEQVERSPGHLALAFKDHGLTYEEFNKRVNQLAWLLRSKQVKTESIVGLMIERSIGMIIGMLAVLKAGSAFLPIDNEYPETRKKFILEECAAKVLLTQKHILHKKKKEIQSLSIETIICLDNEDNYSGDTTNLNIIYTPSNLAYIIYTSGTSGKPKGVMVNHQSIVNYIYWAGQNYVKNKTIHFPFYTSISFDLTLTSLFTPLLTGNAIIIYDEEEKETLLERIINENKIEAVKLTPSHLELIKYVYKDETISADTKIKCLIVGGEKLENKLAMDIYKKFNGKIEIYNEYGPTEATVGCMIYCFDPTNEHGKSVPIGKPIHNIHIYILDKKLCPVSFGIPGELYIGGIGGARGYLNRVELTSEKFIKNPFIKSDRLYCSGDLVRRLMDGNIEFLGRVDGQVKIMGYRIELDEIKNQLLTYPGIKEALVIDQELRKGRENDTIETAMGTNKYLCAYIVSQKKVDDSGLKEYLSKKLPDYMIPLYFMNMDRLPLTFNGKVDTKALPLPKLKIRQGYDPPRMALEKRLVEIWSEVLGVEKDIIGIDTNFFELGGNSLRATILVARIHKALDVKLPLAEVFKTPTIRNLAKYLKEAVPLPYKHIELVEKKEYYILSYAQKRIYTALQLELDSTSYNMPLILKLTGELDLERLQESFQMLIERHESLRSSFEIIGNEPVQQLHDKVEFSLQYLDQGEKILELRKYIQSFDLTRAPLLRVYLLKIRDREYGMMMDISHLISDGISSMVMAKDLMRLYNGQELSRLKIQYKDFSEWENYLFHKGEIKKQEDFWLNEFKGELPLLELPTDFPRPDVRNADAGDIITTILGERSLQKLNDIIQETGSTLFTILLAIYNVLLNKYSGQEDIVVGSVVTGRTHEDLENVMGVFINMLPLRNRPQPGKNFREFLEEVKENAWHAFENQDYPIEELVKKLEIRNKPGRHPLFDTEFAVGNLEFERITIPGLKMENYGSGINFSKFDLHFLVIERNHTLIIILRYSTELFNKSTAEKIIQHFVEIIGQVIENPGIKLADIEITMDFVSLKSSKLDKDQEDFNF